MVGVTVGVGDSGRSITPAWSLLGHNVIGLRRRLPWRAFYAAYVLGFGLLTAAAVGYGTQEPDPTDLSEANEQNLVVAGVYFRSCGSGHRYNCVIDGDTIWYDGAKIRLSDIDAPETGVARCRSEAALGIRAKYRLLELINAGPFRLIQRHSRDEDVYGRKLRVIERDGRSLGDVLIAEGLARRWDVAKRNWCG
jgi:endonuclease YncB( thermonuclease family)